MHVKKNKNREKSKGNTGRKPIKWYANKTPTNGTFIQATNYTETIGTHVVAEYCD